MDLEVVEIVVVYPLTLLVSVWLLGALFAYTLKSTEYSKNCPFTVGYIDPGIAYLKEKALIIGVEVAFVAFKKFREKMGKDSNIEYREKHCIVDVRDRGRRYKLYVPFHRDLRREARYKITAESEPTADVKKTVEHIHTVPGVPVLVSAWELGKDVIKCSNPNGEVIWHFKESERPVCHMILHTAER